MSEFLCLESRFHYDFCIKVLIKLIFELEVTFENKLGLPENQVIIVNILPLSWSNFGNFTNKISGSPNACSNR